MLDYPVVTPENIAFRFTVAGPASRLVAWMVDMLVLMAVTAFLGAVVALGSHWIGNYAFAAYGVLSFLLFVGYWIFFELRWQGRSPGKRLLGLRVVGERGLPLDFSQVLLRNLLRPVDVLPGAAGLAAAFCLLQSHHRRLGDLVAGTLVIHERRPRRPGAILSKEHSRQLQAVSAGSAIPLQLGSRLSTAEVEFVLDLCRRRDSLLNSVRLQLFAAVATELRRRFAVARSESLSDEMLVLLICAQLLESEEKTS
jgi:uncharacterized RDD family membrane protein YckC